MKRYLILIVLLFIIIFISCKNESCYKYELFFPGSWIESVSSEYSAKINPEKELLTVNFNPWTELTIDYSNDLIISSSLEFDKENDFNKEKTFFVNHFKLRPALYCSEHPKLFLVCYESKLYPDYIFRCGKYRTIPYYIKIEKKSEHIKYGEKKVYAKTTEAYLYKAIKEIKKQDFSERQIKKILNLLDKPVKEKMPESYKAFEQYTVYLRYLYELKHIDYERFMNLMVKHYENSEYAEEYDALLKIKEEKLREESYKLLRNFPNQLYTIIY